MFTHNITSTQTLFSPDSSPDQYVYVAAFFDFVGSCKHGCKPPTASMKVSASFSEEQDEEDVAIVKK